MTWPSLIDNNTWEFQGQCVIDCVQDVKRKLKRSHWRENKPKVCAMLCFLMIWLLEFNAEWSQRNLYQCRYEERAIISLIDYRPCLPRVELNYRLRQVDIREAIQSWKGTIWLLLTLARNCTHDCWDCVYNCIISAYF